MRQPVPATSTPSHSSLAARPACSAAPPRSTVLICRPGVSFMRRPSRCCSCAGSSSTATPCGCSSASSGSSRVPWTQAAISRVKARPAQLLEHRREIGLGHRAGLAALPQGAHHRVERGLAFRAQRQVEAQRDQRALGVVAHRRIGGVLVLAVVLDPGIEAGLRHRLHLAPRRLQHLVDGLVQQLEVGRVVDQAGAAQQQVVVVAGEALEEPQQLRCSSRRRSRSA